MKRGKSPSESTILLVEDNALVLDSTARLLQGLGYRVLRARGGEEALGRLAGRPQIDLLVSDVVMPGGMMGQELARTIKDHLPAIKVLLISAYPRQELIASGRIDANTPLLAKPFRAQKLLASIEALLGVREPQSRTSS